MTLNPWRPIKLNLIKLLRKNSALKAFSPSINQSKQLIEGVKVKKLLSQYGSPLFIVSQEILNQKLLILTQVLKSQYPHFSIAYSIKTNNLFKICQFFKRKGILAEVVSDYEYWLAKKLGYSDSNIIFNGPHKTEKTLHLALKHNAKIHLDNQQELELIQKLSQPLNKKINIGVRLNTFTTKPNSRFGFNIETSEASKIIKKIVKTPQLTLNGIHLHLGSNISHTQIYQKSLNAICKFINQTSMQIPLQLEYLDVGGGFPVLNSGAFDWQLFTYSINDYIKAITQPIKSHGLSRLKLILEPGRYLVDEAILLISTVLHSRQNQNHNQVTVDISSSILPLARTRFQKISLIQTHPKRKPKLYKTNIFGSSCIETDILAKNQPLPLIHSGDIICFHNAGAYNLTQSSQFISPRPAVVMIANKKTLLIKKAEANQDLFYLNQT